MKRKPMKNWNDDDIMEYSGKTRSGKYSVVKDRYQTLIRGLQKAKNSTERKLVLNENRMARIEHRMDRMVNAQNKENEQYFMEKFGLDEMDDIDLDTMGDELVYDKDYISITNTPRYGRLENKHRDTLDIRKELNKKLNQ